MADIRSADIEVCMRYLATILLAWSSLAAAAPPVWLPDPTFGTDGASTLEIDPGADDEDSARLLVSDAQKRLYLIGTSENDDGECLALARFLPDGQLDSANYGEGGKRCIGNLFEGGGQLFPTDALVQADGKLVVAGFTGPPQWPVVCRFDTSGHLDTAQFGSSATPGCALLDDVRILSNWPPGTPSEALLKPVSVAMDDSMLRVALLDDNQSIRLARLTADGNVVPFGQSSSLAVMAGGAGYFLSDIAVTDDGMLVLSGIAPGDMRDFFVGVLDPDSGDPDPVFHTGEVLTFSPVPNSIDIPTALVFNPEGDIVVAGGSGATAIEMRPSVAVITRQGEFLLSFNSGYPANYNPCVFYFGDCEIYVTDVEALPDGKLLLGGYALQDGFHRAYTMRLQSDGTPDASYGPNIPGQQGYARLAHDQAQVATSMLLQDGQTVLAGWRDVGGPNGKDFFVTRLSDGSLFRDGFDEAP